MVLINHILISKIIRTLRVCAHHTFNPQLFTPRALSPSSSETFSIHHHIIYVPSFTPALHSAIEIQHGPGSSYNTRVVRRIPTREGSQRIVSSIIIGDGDVSSVCRREEIASRPCVRTRAREKDQGKNPGLSTERRKKERERKEREGGREGEKKEISRETHRHGRREGRLARKKDSRELRRVGRRRGWNGR